MTKTFPAMYIAAQIAAIALLGSPATAARHDQAARSKEVNPVTASVAAVIEPLHIERSFSFCILINDLDLGDSVVSHQDRLSRVRQCMKRFQVLLPGFNN